MSAVTGLVGEDIVLGCFQHYLQHQEECVTETPIWKCTSGKKKGPWLDAWLKIEQQGKPHLLQIEIKNWCANSYGKVMPLPIDADDKAVSMLSSPRW